jgi:hypothetical protein
MVLPPSTTPATARLRRASSASGNAIAVPSSTETTVIQTCSTVESTKDSW